jgi:integrase
MTYTAALGRFKQLLEQDAGKGTDDYLVSSLLNQYRTHLHQTRKSAVPGVFEVMARGFAQEFGSRRVCELEPTDFDEWLGRQEQWNPTSKAHAVALLLGALSWARKKRLIQTDPLAGRVERPQPILRGRDARMPEELMDLLVGECFAKATYHRTKRTGKPAVHLRNSGFSENFGKLLWLLRLTGARPGELRNAEAHNYHGGRLVFRWNATRGYVHKTARKTQRDRVIFLTPEAQAYTEECIRQYPEGPIYRTPRDDPWTLQNCANKWRRWLLKRPKVVAYLGEHGIDPANVRMYNFRHSWACTYLDTTGDIFGAALMLGTSVKMLQTRYFHMDEEKLHQRYLAFMTGQYTPRSESLASES